jgi:peptidoglycan/xylan/chitin deacetylase (PgdA/CDA1 family)
MSGNEAPWGSPRARVPSYRMLRQAKLGALRFAAAAGISRLLADSPWRRNRLLILCYHGVSCYDEHEWDPVYITAETLRHRMQLLVEERCTVLPLAEAVRRLRSGTLPPRAVALTFDDGYHDFYSVAFPLLESFGFPVTLYLTTYYVEFNRPVFDPMVSYLLWRGREQQSLLWPEVSAAPLALDDASREATIAKIKAHARARTLSGEEKDQLLARLADRLGIDYEDLCRRRVLHLINPEEARQMAARKLDLEYHTHRHRVYRSRKRMFADLDDNRVRLEAYRSSPPQHFCYASGVHLPQHVEYLRAYGIRSATTCRTGYCTAQTNPWLLPRFIDTTGTSELEYRAWLAGTASLLPQRREVMDRRQLIEE